MSAGRVARRLLAALIATWLSLVPRAAKAHDPFEITTLALVGARALELRVTMTQSAAARYLAGAREASAGSARNPDASLAALLAAHAPALFAVTSAGASLSPVRHGVAINAESEVEFQLEYGTPRPGTLRLEAKHLNVLPEGYVNSVTVQTVRPARVLNQRFLHTGDAAFDTTLPAQASERAGDAGEMLPEPWPRRLRRFVALGVHHVLTGFDHLLFLVGILLPCLGWRSLVGLVTCFTLAHSASLLAVTLAGWTAPSSVVEPLIAASIVFVAIENLVVKGEPRARYAVTFAFGLVHGLGFASALRETTSQGVQALPIVSFNLGVELAQLTLAAVFLPLLLALRRREAGASVTRALSAVCAVAGMYWMLERTLFA